jgi:hypothetical protein
MHITSRSVTAPALAALMWAAVQSAGSCSTSTDAALAQAQPSIIPASADGAAVVGRWNEQAYAIAFAQDSFRTFRGHRAFAMMHLAMHDALNAVTPRYRQHTFTGRDAHADAQAAVAQAAHDVLLALYPEAAAQLETELSKSLERVPDETARARGIALGRRAASAHLAERRDDRWDLPGRYEFRRAPGSYRTTPPWGGFVLQPGFRQARPFGISAPDQFRPQPPPPLASADYARAMNEVRRVGGAESHARTEDQTGLALWWMEFVEGSVNRLAGRLVVESDLSLADAARLFALLNVSLYDTYIAVWDSKYHFGHWRPYSAIREAGTDGNASTEPDSTWRPLRLTPPFPEYVSAHAAACAATFDVLERAFGDVGPFSFSTITAPDGMPTRRFASFADAAAECAESRILLGWHFRYATDAGLQLGRKVSAYVWDRHLAPR